MPTSRTRRTRNRSNSARKRERARKARAERASGDGESQVEAHAQQFTEADWATIRESARVAAEGQLDKALELYDAVTAVAGSEPSRGMRQLSELGDDAPPWAWSRWIREQAFRWVSSDNQSRIELALDLAVDVAYPAGLDADDVAFVLARDWIVRQVVLYELGGLHDFVVNVAGDELLARAEPMLEWRCAPMGAYQLVDETPDCTRLLDLETEEWIEVLNVGCMIAVEPGGFVLGRVVPISAGPGLMFESRPLNVDELTARRFGERWIRVEEQTHADNCGCDPDECDGLNCDPFEYDPPEWWDELQDACCEGRVPAQFSLHLEYPLLTDVANTLWRCALDGARDQELVDELVRSGIPRTVAQAAQVAVCGLMSAPIYGAGLTAGGPIYGAALLEPGVMEVLMERFTLPQYAPGWRALAELVVDPARKRCLSLAEACARFGVTEDAGTGPVDIIEQVFPNGLDQARIDS
jgi:hypothetical protein